MQFFFGPQHYKKSFEVKVYRLKDHYFLKKSNHIYVNVING